ncbi:permease prefix domain 1-containing protein [Clostridium sp.]|uniref:permease prefix domain 1-containing protein n=1 Tax=Clostridium sp. TaxID=1506 RepID=UPI00284355CE|nr:permease prefix domain 1-containing protein [Clostridium sp.]MDR3595176.1 permease prefix domain 1-containing protein [Clostridium sp.]
MNRIEAYINSVYKNVQGNQDEVEDLKQEMRSHLLQTVDELKNEGKTEEESIKIAISRFGECGQVENELSKVFKVKRKFAKTLLIVSIVSLLLSSICYISYRVTDDMFRLRIPQTLKNAVGGKLEAGDQISYEEVTELLTKYKKQFRYVGVYKESNYSRIPDILYPSNFSVEEVENDECTLTTYPTSIDGTVWKVQYGFDYNGFLGFIPGYLIVAAEILFVCYWFLFSIWCVINAHYKKNLSLVWIVIFFTLNVFGYMIYILDKTNRPILKYV